jgi:hypothetical protein
MNRWPVTVNPRNAERLAGVNPIADFHEALIEIRV